MKHLITGLTILILAACSAKPLQPGAQNVRLTHTEADNQCQYLGDVTANQGNFFTGEFTSNENLETGARNEMKNRALAMGGNLVVLLTQRAGYSGSMGEMGGSSAQTNVTLSGNVYHCPEI